jgi:signal transduction histidine kinase
LQLENSLLISGPQQIDLVPEDVSVNQLLGHLRQEFPDLQLQLSQETTVRGDRRALLSLFRNLLANSQWHGKATLLRIQVEKSTGDRMCRLQIVDNGQGLEKEQDVLGKSPLQWSSPESGTGLGLYLCRLLVQRMGGQIQFPKSPTGFTVKLELPEAKGRA